MICARWTCLFCAPNSTLQFRLAGRTFCTCVFFIVHTALTFWKFLFSLSADKNETTVFGNSIDGIRSTPKGRPKKVTPCSTIYTGTKKKRRISFFCLLIFFTALWAKMFIFCAGKRTGFTAAGKRTGPTAQGNVLDPRGTTGKVFLNTLYLLTCCTDVNIFMMFWHMHRGGDIG